MFVVMLTKFSAPPKKVNITYSARYLANLISIKICLVEKVAVQILIAIFLLNIPYLLKGKVSCEIFFHDYSRPNLKKL